MRRHAVRDDQLERIKDILPVREGHIGVTAKDNRLFVEAVLYRHHAGIPWAGSTGTLWRSRFTRDFRAGPILLKKAAIATQR